MASLMFFGNSKLYFKWSWNVSVRSTNRKVEKKKNTRAFEPHVGENIKLNVICSCWGVSHQAVVVPIRGRGSQRADSLPTQPLPTNCYCDKSHLNKYAGYLRGSSVMLLWAELDCMNSSRFSSTKHCKATGNTGNAVWIICSVWSEGKQHV